MEGLPENKDEDAKKTITTKPDAATVDIEFDGLATRVARAPIDFDNFMAACRRPAEHLLFIAYPAIYLRP